MHLNRWILAMLLALALAAAAQEAEEPQDEPPAADDEAVESPPPEDAEPRTLEEIFIPSEEIGADEEVTFPINI
jgi:hypothetical protein